MKKIVILGNSLTGIKTLEALKALGQEFEATVISAENTFPYYRNLVTSLPARKIAQNKIFYRPSEEYAAEKINFIFDKKITRINFKRSRLTLEDKESLEYDFLFLAGFGQEPFCGVKGANKAGRYQLKQLSDMTLFLKLLPLVETIVVQSDTIAGLKAALAFCEAKKEVILLTSGKNILSGFLSDEDAGIIEEVVLKTGLRVIAQNQIVEILGDNDVKAIRLQNGKVLGCQAILTDGDIPDLRLFKETDLRCEQRVCVNKDHQTNFENVFAMDRVCDTIKPADWDISQICLSLVQAQAEIISSKILGVDCGDVLGRLSGDMTWELDINGEVIKFAACAQQFSQTPVLRIAREEKALAL